jgi:hypothetical protein
MKRKKTKSTFYIVLSLINLDLITIFSTLYKKKKYLTNIIIVHLFPIAAICRSTRRKEVIIYDLLSFECYLYENLKILKSKSRLFIAGKYRTLYKF